MQEFCTPEDWGKLKGELLETLKEKDSLRCLVRIWMEEGKYEKVMEIVKQRKNKGFGWDPREDYADELMEHYPEEMIEFYLPKIQNNIYRKKRKTYRIGTEYAAKVKEIYIDILGKEKEWERYIEGIRKEYERRPALQDEFSHL